MKRFGVAVVSLVAGFAGCSSPSDQGAGSENDSVKNDSTYELTMDRVPTPRQISSDPFTNTTSQHATEVEADTFSFGDTIVASSQIGRFFNGGCSDLGFITSTDGGRTFHHGELPGNTIFSGGTFERTSDPSVAFDLKHHTWLISGLAVAANVNVIGVTINRSHDGLHWENPIIAVGNDGRSFDKNWVVCDNSPFSPHFGNCYIEADVTSSGNLVVMSTSRDGGKTWSAPISPKDMPHGLGGQPLVQPNGRVVVPYDANGAAIRSFTSNDGGESFDASVLVSNITAHRVGGGLRALFSLPSAEVDGGGTVYVAWSDCKFRMGCPSNDIVFATTENGTNWSAVHRVPIDPVTSSVDHFIPGIGANKFTAGDDARVAVYYNFYPNANCTAATCQLDVGFISSTNGGRTWSESRKVAGPTSLSQIAVTNQGTMVGDYISVSVVNDRALSVFALGRTPTNGKQFDEAMFTVGGLAIRGGEREAEAFSGMQEMPGAMVESLPTAF